jgi:general secretion pathway protein G
MRKTTFYGLAVVCGVGTLLAGLVLCVVHDRSHMCVLAKSSRVEGDFSSVGSALKMYVVNNGRPPTTEQGLDALVSEPVSGPKPRRWSRVMDRRPLDPWQTPYRYQLLPPTGSQWRWELRSAGPDGVFGSGDDMANEAEAGVYVNSEPVEVGEKVDPRPSF